jgi:murein DD-endopeptidase MepM/ murein hydrolase activator NlpD
MLNLSVKYVFKIIVLGALLAGVVWAMQGPPGSDSDRPEILVTEADVAHQAARWERTWGRPPTTEELRKTVDGYVRNEILYREALAREMDREDPRVRMALIQKMQMLAAGQADARGMTEKDLSAFFALRKEQYRIPARVSLVQVFFKDEEESPKKVEDLLARFQEQEPSENVLREAGDATMIEAIQLEVTATDLERQFGTDFTAEVLSLPEGNWFGPVRSSFGLHLVKVFNRQPGRIPDLAEVRDKVERDLLYEARMASQEQGFQEISGKYRVSISEMAEKMLEGGE